MKLSFRWKTVLGIALIEAVFLFVLIMNSLSILQQSHAVQIERRASTLVRIFAAATTDAVLSTDLATLDAMIAELASNREVLYVGVFGNAGLLAESQGGRPPEPGDSVNEQFASYSITEPISVDEEIYGKVKLILDTSDVNVAWQTARRESINIALLEVFLVALASLLLGTYLTRHLNRLRTGIESVKKGSYELIEVGNNNDEVGQTVRAFNDLSLELKESHLINIKAIEQTRDLADKLSRREQWLRAVIDNIADGIITLDERGQIRSANMPAQKILGYHNKELKGVPYDLVILDERQRERISRFIQTSRKETEPFATSRHSDEIGYRRDGTPFSMDLTLSYARFEGQDVFILLIRDLTLQKEIEHQALLSETIKSGMLEASLSAVIAIDEQDNVIEFNPAAERIFGHRREDILGKEMAEIILPARFRKAHSVGMKRYLETGVGPVLRQRIQLAALRKNGDEFPVELAITPIAVGEKIVFMAVLDDITERLQATAKLEEAKESADKANLAKSRFLASMSHEIRTPLNVILGMVELLQGTDLTAQQRSMIYSAENAGRSLLEVINDVLDLSKIEAGKMQARPVRFNPAKIVEETAALFRQRAWSKKLGLHVVITRSVPANIISDATFFRQIIINLLSNAIKYTATGGVLIRLHAETVAEQQILTVDVQDTGEGISRAKQSQIFEEFTQLHTIADGTTGTGLGLVICQQLSKLMQGDLTFVSDLGKGSCFSLRLPLSGQRQQAAVAKLVNRMVVIYSTDSLWRQHYVEQIRSWGLTVYACQIISELSQVLDLHVDNVDALIVDQAALDTSVDHLLSLINAAYPDKFGILLSQRDTAAFPMPPRQINGVLAEPSTRMQLARGLFSAFHRLPWTTAPLPGAESLMRMAKNAVVGAGRILLVEDSEANRIIARAFLEQGGYEVVEAVDGVDAIRLLRQSAFELVLMDMRMPNLGGVEATKIIRDEGLAATTPIIALTAHALKQEKDACLAAGMQDFLTKPIDKASFLETVGKWVTRDVLPAQRSSAYADASSASQNAEVPIKGSVKLDPSIEEAELVQETAIQQLIADTNEAAAKRMLNIFDSEARKRAASIAEFIQASDYEQVETSVHALKSSAQTFGAYRLHLLAKQAEACCRAGHYDQAFQYCARLVPLVSESLKALESKYGYRQ